MKLSYYLNVILLCKIFIERLTVCLKNVITLKKYLGFNFLPYVTRNEAVSLLQAQIFNWLGTLS